MPCAGETVPAIVELTIQWGDLLQSDESSGLVREHGIL